jgi:hypothetical protein
MTLPWALLLAVVVGLIGAALIVWFLVWYLG